MASTSVRETVRRRQRALSISTASSVPSAVTHGSFMGRILLQPLVTFINSAQAKLPQNSFGRNNDCLHLLKLIWVIVGLFLIIFIQLGIIGHQVQWQRSDQADSVTDLHKLKNLDALGDAVAKEMRSALLYSVLPEERARAINLQSLHNKTTKRLLNEFETWPFDEDILNLPDFARDADQWSAEMESHAGGVNKQTPLAEVPYYSMLMSLIYRSMGATIRRTYKGGYWPQYLSCYLLKSARHRIQFADGGLAITAYRANPTNEAAKSKALDQISQKIKTAPKLLRIAQMFSQYKSRKPSTNLDKLIQLLHAFSQSVNLLEALSPEHAADALHLVDETMEAFDGASAAESADCNEVLAQEIGPERSNQQEYIFVIDISVTVIAVVFLILAIFAMLAMCCYYHTTEGNCRILARRTDECNAIIRQKAELGIVVPVHQGLTATPEVFEDLAALAINIKTFNEFIADAGPSKVVELLNTMHSTLEKATKMYDCYKIESTADCFLAVNTKDSRRKDNSLAVALVAVEVMESTRSFINECKVRLQMGIHCGRCYGSAVGTSQLHYEYFGPPIATAVALTMQKTEETILMSELSKDRLMACSGFIFAFEHFGSIIVDDNLITVYTLVDAQAAATPTPLITTPRPPRN